MFGGRDPVEMFPRNGLPHDFAGFENLDLCGASWVFACEACKTFGKRQLAAFFFQLQEGIGAKCGRRSHCNDKAYNPGNKGCDQNIKLPVPEAGRDQKKVNFIILLFFGFDPGTHNIIHLSSCLAG